MTMCSLLRVEGRTVHTRGFDAIDGTPVLHIKPVLSTLLQRTEIVEPEWAVELMKDHWEAAESNG